MQLKVKAGTVIHSAHMLLSQIRQQAAITFCQAHDYLRDVDCTPSPHLNYTA